MPTITADDKIRVPIVFKGDDREALLRLRYKLEKKANKPITITEAIRIAVRAIADQD